MNHSAYNEYATCTYCGFKKYCRQDVRRFICYACDHGNFNGINRRVEK